MKQIIKELPTWGSGSMFQYSTSILGVTEICFGKDFKIKEKLSSAYFEDLINEFKGKTVIVGTSHTNPPNGSIGKWLNDKKYITSRGIMSYVAPILIEEGFAERVEDTASIKIL